MEVFLLGQEAHRNGRQRVTFCEGVRLPRGREKGKLTAPVAPPGWGRFHTLRGEMPDRKHDISREQARELMRQIGNDREKLYAAAHRSPGFILSADRHLQRDRFQAVCLFATLALHRWLRLDVAQQGEPPNVRQYSLEHGWIGCREKRR